MYFTTHLLSRRSGDAILVGHRDDGQPARNRQPERENSKRRSDGAAPARRTCRGGGGLVPRSGTSVAPRRSVATATAVPVAGRIGDEVGSRPPTRRGGGLFLHRDCGDC